MQKIEAIKEVRNMYVICDTVNILFRGVKVSVVIVGGNERMVCKYEDVCKNYGCKAKVFAKEKGILRKKIGCPDLMILFTNTVSHKMAMSASKEAKKNNIQIVHVPTSSIAALEQVLSQKCHLA